MKKKFGMLALLLVLLGGEFWVYANDSKSLRLNDIQLELGNLLKAETLVSDSVKREYTVDREALQKEINKKGPLSVGEHAFDIHYQSKIFKRDLMTSVNVTVKDTVAPVFVKKLDLLKLKFGESVPSLEDLFEATDQSDVVYHLDDSRVEFKIPGIYDATVEAKDAYENIVTHPIKIEILKEEVPVVENGGSASKLKYVQGILIVNKKYALPSDYAPGEIPEAKQALLKLIAEMRNRGFDISTSYSGFRTYWKQESLYNRYVSQDGKALADTYSARPGHSEHQTGLTYDLLHTNGALVEKEAEVLWIRENAAKYGFVVRYPKGKEHITGYQYEPWHLRYIGDKAEHIMSFNLTLEEYLGVEGGDYR